MSITFLTSALIIGCMRTSETSFLAVESAGEGSKILVNVHQEKPVTNGSRSSVRNEQPDNSG
jgi:hypothetical protein